MSYKKAGGQMLHSITIWAGALSLIISFIVMFVRSIIFNRKCAGHLLRATAANSVEMAKQELGIVVHYFEAKGWTNGFTSIWWTTPQQDVGFFYRNLRASYNQLKNFSGSSTEKSMLLVRLRSSIQDMPIPADIFLFPYNRQFAVWQVLSLTVLLGGIWSAISN